MIRPGEGKESSSGLLALPDDLLTAVCTAAGAGELPALRLACTALLHTANAAALSLRLRRTAGVRLASFPSVKEVAVEDWSEGWSEGWLAELAQALPALESLRLGRLQALTPTGAAALALLPHLRRFDLTSSSLSDSALAALASPPLGCLTSLSLRECCNLSDTGLAGLLSALPMLREADLAMCTQLADASLAQMGRCAQLAKLDLTGCERFR